MSETMATALENDMLDYKWRGDAPPAVTLAELALCTDGSFTEATAGSYSRANLTSSLSTASSGAVSDSFSFDVGSDVVTHWMLMHDNVWKARGALNDSHTGAFVLDLTADCLGT